MARKITDYRSLLESTNSIACDLPNRSCCFTAMNWYTHIYTYASYASPWAPNTMKSALKDLFPHLVGVFNIWALSKTPSYLPVMLLGWRYRKPPSSWAYCSGYLMLPPDISMKQWNKSETFSGMGPARTLIGQDMFLGSSNVKFDSSMPWDPLGDPDPTAPVRD